MLIATANLRHKRVKPRRQGSQVTDSLPCHELTESEEPIRAQAHGALAVSLRSQVLEERVDRLSQPRAADARAGPRAGAKAIQHNEPLSVQVPSRVVRRALHPCPSKRDTAELGSRYAVSRSRICWRGPEISTQSG